MGTGVPGTGTARKPLTALIAANSATNTMFLEKLFFFIDVSVIVMGL